MRGSGSLKPRIEVKMGKFQLLLVQRIMELLRLEKPFEILRQCHHHGHQHVTKCHLHVGLKPFQSLRFGWNCKVGDGRG